MVKTKPYKDITLEFDEEKHRFTIAGRDIISVTGATSMIYKELTWWAAGEALKKLGWYNEKKIKEIASNEEEFNRLISVADNNLAETFEKIKKMDAKEYFNHLKEAYKAHKETKDAAADLGTQIHDLIELFIKGKKPKIPNDERVKNGFLAFLKWVDENKIKFLGSESHIYSKKYDYAGILDIEAKINGKLAIVDIKSSNGIYNEMRYQVSGYRGAKEEMTKKKYEESWIIQLGKETGEFKAYRLDDHPKDFKAFLGALAIKRREIELKK